MDATDGAGRAGITANVNNHYGRPDPYPHFTWPVKMLIRMMNF
jgi:hypothetical protein